MSKNYLKKIWRNRIEMPSLAKSDMLKWKITDKAESILTTILENSFLIRLLMISYTYIDWSFGCDSRLITLENLEWTSNMDPQS